MTSKSVFSLYTLNVPASRLDNHHASLGEEVGKYWNDHLTPIVFLLGGTGAVTTLPMLQPYPVSPIILVRDQDSYTLRAIFDMLVKSEEKKQPPSLYTTIWLQLKPLQTRCLVMQSMYLISAVSHWEVIYTNICSFRTWKTTLKWRLATKESCDFLDCCLNVVRYRYSDLCMRESVYAIHQDESE